MPPPTDETVQILAWFYQSMYLLPLGTNRAAFLNAGCAPQADAGNDPPADLTPADSDAHPAPRPGPIRPGEPTLAERHLDHHTARILAGLYHARLGLLPLFAARNADERDAIARALIRITGVAPLLADGRLTGCTVCWAPGRWPRFATAIRVSLPGGEAERRRLLGALEPHLRRFIGAIGDRETAYTQVRRPRSKPGAGRRPRLRPGHDVEGA